MKGKRLIISILAILLVLSITVVADTNKADEIISIVEIRLKSGSIESYNIYRSEETEDRKQIEDTLRYLIQDEDVIDILKIDGQPLEKTEYKEFVKDLWQQDDKTKEEEYKSESGFDLIGKDEEGKIVEKEDKEILQKVNVLVDNIPLKSDAFSFIKDGRVMVPIRFVADTYGAAVGWKPINDNLKIIYIEKNQFCIYLKIGDTRAFRSNETIYMDTAPMLMNDRTFVPLSFIKDIFGYSIEYNSKTNTANICTNKGVKK